MAVRILKSLLRPYWRRWRAYASTRPAGGDNRDWLVQLKALGIDPVKVALDVGANSGQTVRTLRWAFPEAKCHMVEPHPTHAKELRYLYGESGDVKVHELAFSDTNEPQRFYVNSFSETSSLLPPSEHSKTLGYMKTVSEVTVQCMTLDQFCVKEEIEQIDLLKLDTQGNELRILRGAQQMLPKVRAIFAEIIFFPTYEGQASAWELGHLLEQNEFSFFAFYHTSSAQNGRLLYGNGLWLNRRFFPKLAMRELEPFEQKLNSEMATQAA